MALHTVRAEPVEACTEVVETMSPSTSPSVNSGQAQGERNMSRSVRRSTLAKQAIHVTPMANVLHGDVQRVRVHLVHNSVIPNPKAVQTLGSLQLSRLGWKGIGRQAFDTRDDASNDGTRNGLEIFVDGRLVTEAIGGHACEAASSFHQR